MASVADALGSGLNYVLPGYGAEGAPPGVAGPAGGGGQVIFDPGTGLYVNQRTGAVSTDPAGQKVVQDPSLATQAARNIAISNQFLSSLGEYGQQYRQAQAGQTSLAGKLNATIAGTAPSVAGSQLEEGLGRILQQQQAQASGATGESGALARSDAMRNAGVAEAATNQQQAGLRAQEVSGAENTLAGLLGAQANEASGMFGTGTNAALNAGGAAGTEEGNREQLVQAGGKNQLTTLGTIASAGGSALSTGGSGSGGGSGASTLASGLTTSDPDAKENIEPADMKDFMSKLASITFDYKDPSKDGDGKRIGTDAKAAQKSKVGRAITVGKDPVKLDNGNAIGAALAGIANLHKRLSKVENGRA